MDISTIRPWEPRDINQSGIQRLKLASSESLSIVAGKLIPQGELLSLTEFVFGNRIACSASIQKVQNEQGSILWRQSINFILPHFSNSITSWISQSKDLLWIVVTEDFNGEVRVFGGSPHGLTLEYQAGTGGVIGDVNPMSLQLSGEQLLPFVSLESYDENPLFSLAEFDESFDFSFN